MQTKDTKFEETAIIIRQEEIADDIYSMWLRTEHIAAHAKAGQFVSVYCNEGSRLLPRPISICEIDRKDGAIRLVYRVAGKGTAEFSGMRTGMQLKVVGPLGNGFPQKKQKGISDRWRNRNPANVRTCQRVRLRETDRAWIPG